MLDIDPGSTARFEAMIRLHEAANKNIDALLRVVDTMSRRLALLEARVALLEKEATNA